MKKYIALILLLLVLLSSCTAPTDQSKETSSDTTAAVVPPPVVVPQSQETEMKITNGIVVTSKYPEKRHAYLEADEKPPSDISYILLMKGELDESVISYKLALTYKFTFYQFEKNEKIHREVKPNFAGIIDNKEKFISCYEALTGEKYVERFSDTFFDDNIIIISRARSFERTFVGFEYGFDINTKKLKITFITRPHEGWKEKSTDDEGTCIYIVPIAKKDIMIDGKLVAYDELNVEYTGIITDNIW